MSERIFELQLNSRYAAPDNTPVELRIALKEKGQWQDFDLHYQTPGFLIFVYALFSCQHTYLRLNCADKGIQLASSQGRIRARTDGDWDLQELTVEFQVKTLKGRASSDDITHIAQRMEQCPASRNIKPPQKLSTKLDFTLE